MTAACAVLLPVRLFGGHEKMLFEWLGRAAKAHGLGVRVYCADNDRLVRACLAAGLQRPSVTHPRRASGARDFLLTWRLLGRIPRELPILFAPGVLQSSPLQWLAAFLRGRRVAGYVPMTYSARHMRFRGGRVRDWLIGPLVRRVDVWITISERQRDLLVRQWGVRRPVFVVPNRLALLEDRPAPVRAAKGGRLRVLFFGRFDANQKGLDWLCGELRARRAQWPGRLRFAFHGEGAYGAELVRLSRELGARNVAVHGWSDAGRAMADADVLLIPSRFEGLPLVALEATHFGLPIVASREAGVSGFVAPSCLFRFGDAAAMWDALGALGDPAARAAAAAHARRRLRELLSPEGFAQELQRIVCAFAAMGERLEA